MRIGIKSIRSTYKYFNDTSPDKSGSAPLSFSFVFKSLNKANRVEAQEQGEQDEHTTHLVQGHENFHSSKTRHSVQGYHNVYTRHSQEQWPHSSQHKMHSSEGSELLHIQMMAENSSECIRQTKISYQHTHTRNIWIGTGDRGSRTLK
jgi:hypothetical protein